MDRGMKLDIKGIIKDISGAQRGIKSRIFANMLMYAGVGWLYYRSFIAMLIGAGLSLLTVKGVSERIRERNRKKLYVQFRELMQSLASSVGTGNSFEKALKRAPEELSLIWSDRKSLLMKELSKMVAKSAINYDVSKALEEFCDALDLEEARQFAQTYRICRETGGNLLQAMQSCVTIISDKLLTLQEIEHVLSQRRMEQKLLLFMPHAFMCFLTLTSGDFILPLFTTFIGRVGVSVALLFVAVATFTANKMLNIKV